MLSFDGLGRRIRLERLQRKPIPILGFAITTVLCTFPIVWWSVIGRAHSDMSGKVFAVFPAAIIGLIVRSYLREYEEVETQAEGKNAQRRFRRIGWVFFTLSLVYCSTYFWVCPHGTGFNIGPMVFTHTGAEGMCRNDVNLGSRYEWSKRISFYWAK